MPTHYDTLGISKDATEKEIKQAEKEVVLKDLQEDEDYKRRWAMIFEEF